MNKLRKIEWVENYYENIGNACGNCVMFRQWREPHGETLSGCLLLEKPEHYPIDSCPALKDYIFACSEAEISDVAVEVPPQIFYTLAVGTAIVVAVIALLFIVL